MGLTAVCWAPWGGGTPGGPGTRGGLQQGAGAEEGGQHQALHLLGSRPAHASMTWSRRAARKGWEPPREPPTSSSPFPASSPPLAVLQLDHSAPWGCSGVGPPLWHSPWDRWQPQPRRDGAGSWEMCWSHQSSFSKVSSGMSVWKGRSQKRVLMPKPVGRGESAQPAVPPSPGCSWGQGTACLMLTEPVPLLPRPAGLGAASMRCTWQGWDVTQLGATVTTADSGARAREFLQRDW